MGGDRNSSRHGSSVRSRRYTTQSQADSAGGPSIRAKQDGSRRHSTKDKCFDNRMDPPDVDEVSYKNRRSSRRGMDPSVSSTKNGDEFTVESLVRRDCTKELKKADDVSSFKSKARRRSSIDPPDKGRGDDPSESAFAPVGSGSTAIQRAMNAHRRKVGNRRHASGSFRDTELAKQPVIRSSTSSSKKKTRRKSTSKPTPPKKEIQGILRKKDVATPPPIAYFGGTVISADDEDSSSESESDEESTLREKKTDEKSLSSIKSGMRRGKYAAVNETALSVTHRSSDDDDSSIESSESESSDFDDIIQTEKFDRDHSHFLRTADLGMTQGVFMTLQSI